MVTLFFVEGIDEKAVKQKPNSLVEVHERSWIPVQDYIQETLKQNNVDYALGQMNSAPKYCAYYVRSFAYFVSEWASQRNAGLLKRSANSPGSPSERGMPTPEGSHSGATGGGGYNSSTDVFERVSVHEHPLLKEEASSECIDQVCKSSRELSIV